MGFGVDVASWSYWQGARAASLRQSIFADVTSVMDFGIIIGVLLAAGLAGKFNPDLAHLRPLADRCHHRRPASRVWLRPAGLWLQYRRVFQRDRFGQPARLVLAGRGFPRQYSGTYLRPLFGLAVER